MVQLGCRQHPAQAGHGWAPLGGPELPWVTSPAREPWAGSSFLHLLRVSRISDHVPFLPSREAGFMCDPLAHVSRVMPRPAPGPRLAGSVGDGAS